VKPSDVVLNHIPPLVGTLGRSESEAAAALLVRACQVRGDKWAPVAAEDLGETLSADLDARVEPWASLDRNPFFRPDFWALVEEGNARFTGEAGKSPIEFTEQGIEKLRRWART